MPTAPLISREVAQGNVRVPQRAILRAPMARRTRSAMLSWTSACFLALFAATAFVTGGWKLQAKRCPSRLAAGASASPAVKLYQFESCPFCSKVRAYCDYNGVKLNKIEVNPVTKAQIDGVAGDYKKVPIADIDGEIVTGSADIIRKIGSAIGNSESEADAEWGQWVDSTLVKTLPPNIYRTPEESLQIAGKVGDNFDFVSGTVAKYFGGAAMFFVAKSLAKKAGISKGKEREALYDACAKWEGALGEKPYLSGDKPGMADLEVFGVLSSVEGTDTHRDMLANTGISSWYGRMKKACGRD
ncbi:PTGES2 [Symbiodinium natans]|uniref:Prostaglandin E synthase 2 n=1 Tax=Symbiodinium natans TaxID=878477 RepID=A0A812SPY0_9DINO|nr:PTGES2 [Symbiodinium natans]